MSKLFPWMNSKMALSIQSSIESFSSCSISAGKNSIMLENFDCTNFNIDMNECRDNMQKCRDVFSKCLMENMDISETSEISMDIQVKGHKLYDIDHQLLEIWFCKPFETLNLKRGII